MTENFLSHEKSMKINNKNNKKDPFIELDFVSAKNMHIIGKYTVLAYNNEKFVKEIGPMAKAPAAPAEGVCPPPPH